MADVEDESEPMLTLFSIHGSDGAPTARARGGSVGLPVTNLPRTIQLYLRVLEAPVVAIADDGHGRISIPATVTSGRSNRTAMSSAGPRCARARTDGHRAHCLRQPGLRAGALGPARRPHLAVHLGENLRRMQAKGWREHRWWLRRWAVVGRAERAERSRQLAAAVGDK